MAKKYRVKYAFGTPAIYAAAKTAGTLDEYTVYFIADENEEIGTIYRGAIRIGTAKASDLIFDQNFTIVLARASEEGDEDLTVTINKGSSLVDVISDLYKREYDDVTELSEKIDILNGTGEGSVVDTIDKAIIDKTTGTDSELYSRTEADATFFRLDQIDSLQAIADIMADPEKMEQLVDAARHIADALEPYYTKEEIHRILLGEGNINIVQTYDSSSQFPAAGDANKNVFYVDDEENIVYRWGLNDEGDGREYVEISGTGAAASSDITLETYIFVKGGKTTFSIAKGTNFEIEFVFSSANTMTQYNKRTKQFEKIQQQIGTTASVKYLLDGVQFDSGSIRQGNYYEDDDSKNNYNKLVVPAAKFNASSHELKIVATDIAGNSATETVTINIVSANITSSYVVTPTSLDHDINIPVTVTSTGDSELFYSIDGEEAIKVQDVPVGSPVINIVVPSEGRTHGYHTIKIWATTYIAESDTTISTRVLTYDVIWYDNSNPLPIITTSYDIDPDDEGKYNVTQYEYATLTYQVYPASTVDLVLHDVTAGLIRIVNTLNVDTIAKSWTYTFDTVGEYELYVNVHYGDGDILSSKKYNIVVAKSEISMDATPGAVLYFTAKNRSNNEANPAIWRNEATGNNVPDVEANLTGFLWNSNSGWSTNGATTSLKVAGGARCEIPFYPFGNDYRTTGQVFEVDFSTSNLADSTAEVITCYSDTDKSGITITATGAYFASSEFGETTDGDARIFVPFKENERVRLSFVITPWLSDEEGHAETSDEAWVNLWDGTKYTPMNSITLGWWRFVKIYLNGVCIGIHNYSNGFKQQNPAPIVIGSDKATVNIYSIRVYNTVLYDRAIVNNFIADTQDPAEKLRLFKRNNILNESGTDVESSSLRRLMPCIFITCQTDATASGIVNNEHILPTNKADKRGVTIFFDCDGLNDEAREYYKFCHSFVAFNVQFAVQGTSSQYYPRRNWKATLKPQKKFTADYVANATSSKPTYLFYDIPWETSIADGRDARAVYVNKYKDQYSNKYQLKDYSEEFTGISDDKRTVDEISSIPAKKFCLKADFAESSGTHNTGFAKYVDVILKSLGRDYLTPPQKTQYDKTRNMVDVTFRTSVDGYPIAMFWRPTFEDDWEFYGKFNFNLDKGAESVFGFIDLSDGGITETDINPATGQPFVEFNEDYYDSANQDDRLAYETPIECWEFTNNSTDLCKFRNVTETSFTEKTIDADGKTETPLWLGSFEVRHPDNDNLIDLDYGTGLKVPTHWSKFCQWVSSTDRTGYHNNDKNLPVPTAWTGTYADFIAGSTAVESFGVYKGKLSEMNEDTTTELDYTIRYLLQPEAIDPGDGTISPDQSYPLYGHLVHYNSLTSAWYDSTKELNVWVDDGFYEAEDTVVDYGKAYYMANQSDANYGNVYAYNASTGEWNNIATISQYALATPVVYNTISYAYDTAEYRFAKFKNELQYHMNIPMTTAYYVLTEFFCCADQRAKNMMFASWGYEPGAANVKAAGTFANETEAAAAGYKPVYKYELGTIAGAPTRSIYAAANDATGIVINEILPDGKKMEFYNTTDKAVSLANCVLSGIDDTGAARADWTFPSTAEIAAHGYYVITFKSSDLAFGPAYGLSPKKAWSFTLTNGAGTVLDTVSHDGHNLGTKSMGRNIDGGETWVEFDYPTIGEPNEASTIVESEVPTYVCFNEIDANGTNNDKFIELYNPTSSAINLDGWTLKKGDTVTYESEAAGIVSVENDKSRTFDNTVEIPANGYLVVKCIKKSSNVSELPSGISADGGFVLRLYNASNELVAELNNSKYNDDGSNRAEFINFRSNLRGYETLARDPENLAIWKRSGTSTPGAVNEITPANKSNLDGVPVASAELITTNVIEFSGIARTPDGEDFYAVGDAGGVYYVSEDGSTRLIAEYRASDDVTYPANFEGLTQDDNNNYYAIDEATRDLIKFSNNMLSATVVNTIPAPDNQTGTNSYEGIAYYQEGKFFLGHQNSPTALYLYDVSSNEISLIKNVDCVSEIADIYYDGTYVWLLDSKKCYICKCTVTGDLVEKYVVTNASGKNPEAILVENDYTWLGCDGGNTGNYLIKVALTENGGEEGGDEPGDLDPGEIITDHVVINEINGTTKMIEFYNPTSSDVVLGGAYGLLKTDTDAFGADDWYTFPAGAVIPAYGYFNICCDKSQSGDDGALHTLYGISLNPGKVFHIYLVRYNASLDATSIEGILNTGTVIDDVDNMTRPVNYAEKDMGWSYGRILDGSKNFAMFSTDSMAAVTGPSTDTSLSNANGTPAQGGGGGGEDTPGEETVTIKTVLYWVPANAEYIYYPIFYDNDTILSLDNTGHIKFNPNVESTDRVGTGYAYNGTESVLWLNFKDAFDAEITATYVNMRSKGGLTYQNCMKYFNEGQSDQWPENVYNIDGKFKYVIPATKGYVDYSTQDTTGKYGVTLRNSSYLYECQGSREEHRKWWLNNRFTYMDSRYFAVSYAEDYATIRLYTPSIWSGVTPSSTFKLTPYADMYLRVMFGQIVSTVRAEKNKTYDITPSDPNLRFNDTETIIYGASNILSFGDMTNKYAGSVAIDKASKITDIILGADVPYYNENITAAGLTVDAGNSTLKTLDLRGCTKLTSVAGLNQITSIEKIYAQRTGITSFDFSTDGVNLNEIHYPTTITDIKLVNMKNISYSNIDIPNYSNLKSIWIENCPQLQNDSWRIVSNILSTSNNILSGARIVGFEWNITTNAAYEIWKKLLKLSGFTASGIQSYDVPYLSGTVNIGGEVIVSTGYKEGIEALFADAGGLRVNVLSANTVGLSGIQITPKKNILDNEGIAQIVPGEYYDFDVTYLPDDFVLASEKGVIWETAPALTVNSSTSNSIRLAYVGSTGGNNLYRVKATSVSNPEYTATLNIRPSATLSKIKVTDTNGREIDSLVNINEGETVMFNVDFLPEGTTDTDVVVSVVNGNYIDYTYDSHSKTLTVRGKDVDQNRLSSITLRSANVNTVYTTININVANVVSRIIKLRNGAGDYIPGSIVVRYTDKFTGNPAESTFYTESGIISLRTDSSCGFSELTIDAESSAAADGLVPYNKPATVVIPELPTSATSDVEKEIVFYEPVNVTLKLYNAGAPILDRVLRIDSIENESVRGLASIPYNRVRAGQGADGGAGSPVTIKLLANTTHHITITELDNSGNLVVSGGRYSQYNGIITTGTTGAEYTITISRDYLGGNINQETEVHMTILTGAEVKALNTVRLYVRVGNQITIDWGDKEDYSNSTDVTQWTTVIDGTADKEYNREIAVYHVYHVFNKEYDITVKENTGRIKWFHVIPEDATEMKPCIGRTSAATGFADSWADADYTAAQAGGLIAYQASGDAAFTTMPRFNISSAEDKGFSKFLCVGNIYRKCTSCTNADSLFENTALEQIYPVAIFELCRSITSFNRTFKNSNITSVPANFFVSNTRATSFTETFMNCTNLSTINSQEDTPFVNPDDDVEVTSFVRMFKGCDILSSEVPALWKTFYGCSFNVYTEQKTFEGCGKVFNFTNIPGSWGGNVNKTYTESEFRKLQYIDFGPGSNVNHSNPYDPVFYAFNGIFPEGHWRYELDFACNERDSWGIQPIIGVANGTMSTTNSRSDMLDPAADNKIIDYSRGGQVDGRQRSSTGAGQYTAYFNYHANDSLGTQWRTAKDPITGADKAAVFVGAYGNNGQRIILDISHTEEGSVVVYPAGTNKADTMRKFTIEFWENMNGFVANQPLLFMQMYNDYPNQPDSAQLVTDFENGIAHLNFDNGQYWHGRFITFYSLKVYDSNNQLIHSFVPVYGQHPVYNALTCMLQDELSNEVYINEGTYPNNTHPNYYNCKK